jgi:hypothetical protein
MVTVMKMSTIKFDSEKAIRKFKADADLSHGGISAKCVDKMLEIFRTGKLQKYEILRSSGEKFNDEFN